MDILGNIKSCMCFERQASTTLFFALYKTLQVFPNSPHNEISFHFNSVSVFEINSVFEITQKSELKLGYKNED